MGMSFLTQQIDGLLLPGISTPCMHASMRKACSEAQTLHFVATCEIQTLPKKFRVPTSSV